MRNFIYYSLLMLLLIVLLPLIIVRGPSQTPARPSAPIIQKEAVIIKVYFPKESKIREMLLDEYIKGVVAAEMPAEFELEALKAQAVAARTYALRKMNATKDQHHFGADICTDSTHCQAWVSKEKAMEGWKADVAQEYWNKIEKSVNETSGIIITYGDNIANPVFHANSGGKTENAANVWEGTGEPYLVSVLSEGEDTTSAFKSEKIIKKSEFYNVIKEAHPELKLSQKDMLKDIKILEYTEGDRVKNIRIGNITLKGTEFRSLFSIKSANFRLEDEGKDLLKIITFGYGHGVGMSQWGANYMAKNGSQFDEIIKYYYKGVELETIDTFTVSKR